MCLIYCIFCDVVYLLNFWHPANFHLCTYEVRQSQEIPVKLVTAKKHNNTKNHYNLTPLHSTEVAAGVEICIHLINSNFSLCAGQTKHKKEQHILKFIIDALLLLIKGSLNISASPTYTVRSISSLTLTQFYNFCLFTSPQMTTNETEVQIFIFKCNAIPHFQWLKYKTNRHNTGVELY